MQLPQFGWEITLPEDVSPDNPITLFTIYYTPEIIDLIVEKTNGYMRKPQDKSCPYIRANNWYLTYYKEIYIYLAIRIYISLYVDNEITDYWETKNMIPEYPITKYLGRNRFQELYIHMRFYGNQEQGPYEKVASIFLFLLPETS
jgi:nitric oxide reductase large subunit